MKQADIPNETRGKIFDVHAHLTEAPNETALSEILAEAESAGVRTVISAAARLEDFPIGNRLEKGYNNGAVEIWVSYGIHPWYASSAAENPGWEERLTAALAEPSRTGTPKLVGEIGLDYGERGLNAAPRETQLSVFHRQLAIADRFRLPAVVHSHRAANEVIEAVRPFRNIPLILFHGFAGAVSPRKIEPRFFFSFSEREVGINRRKGRESAARLAQTVPERILAESDYPAGGNRPAGVPETAARLEELGARVTDAQRELLRFLARG